MFSQVGGVTRRSVAKLSRLEVEHLRGVATRTLDPDFVDKTVRFSRILNRALRQKFAGREVVFVSIGQSPAMLAEMLDAMGMQTAICPISGLTNIKNVNSILKNRGFRSYLDYMKRIRLSPDEIKANKGKQYVFVDYSSTGKSLRVFKQLLSHKASGYADLPNRTCISMQDVLKGYQPRNPDEAELIETFMTRYIKGTIVKKYSPIFKLPVSQIGDVQAIRDKTPANEHLNMLKFLGILANP